MDRFTIEIIKDKGKLNFEVVDYVHDHDNKKCKFEVLKEGKTIASFEPDSRGLLHLCKNTGDLDEETLHLIADKLERITL